MDDTNETETGMPTRCPYCKCEVGQEARRCHHCLVNIPPGPTHGGVCPLCTSPIDADALRCKWCKSWVSDGIALQAPSSVVSLGVGPEDFPPWFTPDEDPSDGQPPPPPPPPRWQCHLVDDGATFNPRTRSLWVYEHCEDLNTGAKRIRGVRSRKVSRRELQQWMADNS